MAKNVTLAITVRESDSTQPTIDRYFPAAHSMQVELPAPLVYLPAPHAIQSDNSLPPDASR